MPVLHLRKSALKTEDADGNEVEVPPPHVLIQEGPTVEVSVGVVSKMADQWRSEGEEVPEPVTGQALIDTGATSTCVDNEVAQDLGLPVIDVTTVASASERVEQNVYPVQLDVVHSDLTIDFGRSIGADLTPQGLVALIGRDVLRSMTLHYNGVTGDFTLAI